MLCNSESIMLSLDVCDPSSGLCSVSREYIRIGSNSVSVCLKFLCSRHLENDVNQAVPFESALWKYHSAFVSLIATSLFAESMRPVSIVCHGYVQSKSHLCLLSPFCNIPEEQFSFAMCFHACVPNGLLFIGSSSWIWNLYGCTKYTC